MLKIDLILGLLAGTICTISFLPQVIKAFRTKRTQDISLITFLFLSIGVFIWLIYGILIQQLPVILANTATLFLTVSILILKIKYR